MTLDATGQARYNIADVNGTRHYACCPMCAFKLLKNYGDLNITTFCDYYGPNASITIVAKRGGSIVTVNPTTAIVIAGGSCTKNRLVYNSSAADALLSATNNGTSKWLSPMSNASVATNSTRIGLAQAVLQYGGGTPCACEQCGMTVDVAEQLRLRVTDAAGTNHVTDCQVCALMLLKTYVQLDIVSYCDYYGPSYPIVLSIKQYGSDVTVTPNTALLIDGGNCMKRRLVYNSSAADLLLASPNNGTSQWLSPMYNATMAVDASRTGINQAALQYGGGIPSTTQQQPSITYIPVPAIPLPDTSSSHSQVTSNLTQPAQTATQSCESCGMEVTMDDEAHFKITDGQGNMHYAECCMCALNLIKRYDTLHITTFCDWYGPNYTINVDSTSFGAHVTVTPTTAVYLYAGSCDNNRVAYNQTAAVALKNDYSEYTSMLQQHDWSEEPTAINVSQAVVMYNSNAKIENTTESNSLLVPALVAASSFAVIGVSIVSYRKFRQK